MNKQSKLIPTRKRKKRVDWKGIAALMSDYAFEIEGCVQFECEECEESLHRIINLYVEADEDPNFEMPPSLLDEWTKERSSK